jgi:hypothetical protein
MSKGGFFRKHRPSDLESRFGGVDGSGEPRALRDEREREDAHKVGDQYGVDFGRRHDALDHGDAEFGFSIDEHSTTAFLEFLRRKKKTEPNVIFNF